MGIIDRIATFVYWSNSAVELIAGFAAFVMVMMWSQSKAKLPILGFLGAILISSAWSLCAIVFHRWFVPQLENGADIQVYQFTGTISTLVDVMRAVGFILLAVGIGVIGQELKNGSTQKSMPR